METTDRDESHEQIKRRTKRRMVLAMLSTLAAAVAASFVVEAVDADLMSVIAVVAVASVLVSGWLVLKATRSTSTEEVVLQWAQDTRGWVALVVHVIPTVDGDLTVQEWVPASRLRPDSGQK